MNAIQNLSISHQRFYDASLKETLSDISKSPLAKATAISIIVLSLFAYHRYRPLSSNQLLGLKTCTIVTVAGIAYHSKKLVFESLVIKNMIQNFFFEWEWWNQIDDNIYLGAIPLERFDHEDIFKNRLGITAVLLVLENFELETTTIMGKAVSISKFE